MRTPVPRPAAAPAQSGTGSKALPSGPALTEGKFGKALAGSSGGALVEARDAFRQFPITVECWTRLNDKTPYHILVAHELKSSGTHWEMFSMAGNGTFTTYCPGFTPDHCRSSAMICDDRWHHVAMILELERIRLYVDGNCVADQQHKRTDKASQPGPLGLATLVDRAIGCGGRVDEVRISRGVRDIVLPQQPWQPDAETIGLWHLDELVDSRVLNDASASKAAALLGDVRPGASGGPAKPARVEGHWGESAIGFRWTEADSRDDRFGKVEFGPFFSGSVTGPGGPVYKGIVVRVGAARQASVCYDTELLRVSAGWKGFVRFDPARFGIIVPPRVDGDTVFTTSRFPGVSLGERFDNFREAHPYGPLPKDTAHYSGLTRSGDRVVLEYTVGPPGTPTGTTVRESPWWEAAAGAEAITRTLEFGPGSQPLRLLLADAGAHVRLHPASQGAVLQSQPGLGTLLVVAPRSQTSVVKVLIGSADSNEAALDTLLAASPAPESLQQLQQPGAPLWGPPLVTHGELGSPTPENPSGYVVDTITLPFDNPHQALLFCGGHDFLPDGRAVVCTLHGDVWLVGGLDQSLKNITWQRFATGLFQPLGIRVAGTAADPQILVVGRDQITRLVDRNGDGEADQYINFNNDAHVTLNGHEYVTCLETDRAGNLYYIKGNCNSQTPHDGSLLQVSRDGASLRVFATGFRNSNGIGLGPRDEITVAPQEGEWTPASAVFLVRDGGFYGGMMSHHRPNPPTDFERPLVWLPRLADNSSGGQVWTTSDRFGPLGNQLMHLSYGQCRMRLVLQESTGAGHIPNGASLELPLKFLSGIHRGRMNARDGQLYLTGLKGWTTSAVHDGCFQRVRWTGHDVDLPLKFETRANGVSLTFSRPLDRAAAEDPANYQAEAWNYLWSAAYGSPDYRPSQPGQVGRDEWPVRSATLLDDGRTVFLEIPDIRPVDQLQISATLLTQTGRMLEPSIVFTIHSLVHPARPEQELHRRAEDPKWLAFVETLQPGVAMADRVGERTVASRQRMVAWAPSEPLSSDHRERSVSAWLKVPRTGYYRFSAGDGSQPAELQVGSHPAGPLTANGVEFALTRGLHPLRVQQGVSDGQPPRLRLLWSSPRFPQEAIPASVLFFPQTAESETDLRARGAVLYHQHRCGNCHADRPGRSTRPFPVAATGRLQDNAAPRLDGMGSRLNTAWVEHWILQPQHFQSDTRMPVLLAATDQATAADLAAYLETLPGPSPDRQSVSSTDTADAIRDGERLFEQLGCIGCHTFHKPDQEDPWNRVSLAFARAKFKPGALQAFLEHPHALISEGRMPDFRLSATEAGVLAAFLQARGTAEIPGQTGPAGNAERGQRAFETYQCHRCHATSAAPRAEARRIPLPPSPQTAGCLSAEPGPGRPAFPLAPRDRQAILAWLTTEEPVRITPRPWLETLRCDACHTRDQQSGHLPEIVAEEGSGRPPEAIPHLTWVGEKLQGPWIESFVGGRVPVKPRPWIAARMPAFPAQAHAIAAAFADEHGVAFEEPDSLPREESQIEIGRLLTLREGLDCRQCHGIGSEQPRGDASTQIALGINFAMTRQRLRPEFALRQMLDPPRYDPGSRMPRFAPDLKTTAAQHIEEGNAIRQFERIKQFLWSLPME